MTEIVSQQQKKNITNSLSAYLTTVEAVVVPAMIKLQNWQNIKEIADLFPQVISNFFGFEYRLGSADAYSDFLLCIDEQIGKEILGNIHEKIKLPADLIAKPEWQHLTNFARLWCEHDSLLRDLVSNMWLEFDIEPTVASAPIPSVFFGLFPPVNTDVKGDFAWVTNSALPTLLDRPVSEKVKELVDRCFATLPIEAHVFQVGLMLSRQVDAVRLCIRKIEPDLIIPWLQQLGWQANIERLSQLLAELEPLVDRIDLDIDVGDRIYPKIGLECYLLSQPSQEPRWALFLEYLVGLGLCTAEKQHKLLNYPGYIRDRRQKLDWLLNDRRETVFFNGLHHIKLSYQDRVTEAKAYLYVSRTRINVKEFRAQTQANGGVNQC